MRHLLLMLAVLTAVCALAVLTGCPSKDVPVEAYPADSVPVDE